jgi:hypothetical protein
MTFKKSREIRLAQVRWARNRRTVMVIRCAVPSRQVVEIVRAGVFVKMTHRESACNTFRAGLKIRPARKIRLRVESADSSAQTGGVARLVTDPKATTATARVFWLRLLGWFWSYVVGQVQNLPIIAFTNYTPISLDVFRTPALALNSGTPSSGRPHQFTVGTNVGRMLIRRSDVVAELHFLEPVCHKVSG